MRGRPRAVFLFFLVRSRACTSCTCSGSFASPCVGPRGEISSDAWFAGEPRARRGTRDVMRVMRPSSWDECTTAMERASPLVICIAGQCSEAPRAAEEPTPHRLPRPRRGRQSPPCPRAQAALQSRNRPQGCRDTSAGRQRRREDEAKGALTARKKMATPRLKTGPDA